MTASTTEALSGTFSQAKTQRSAIRSHFRVPADEKARLRRALTYDYLGLTPTRPTGAGLQSSAVLRTVRIPLPVSSRLQCPPLELRFAPGTSGVSRSGGPMTRNRATLMGGPLKSIGVRSGQRF